jgi:hypothetical protein
VPEKTRFNRWKGSNVVIRRRAPAPFFDAVAHWIDSFLEWSAAERLPIGRCYVEFKPLAGAVRRGSLDIDDVGQAFRHHDAQFWLLANCFWLSSVDFELEAKIVAAIRAQLEKIVLAAEQRTFAYPGYRDKFMPLGRDEMDAYYDDHLPIVSVYKLISASLTLYYCIDSKNS